MSEQPAIRLTGLTKRFGSVAAVDHLDLEIAAGEFFSMLGPSGSGKTTVLRCIAGFEQPTSGTIELFGQDVTAKPAAAREVNTVFQDYALFPHMSVLDNVAYGLRVRGVGRTERRRRAMDALASVQLQGFADRKPAQLSGGQRQRVALARATVVQPKALLLDEPLGALDLKLRQQMQVELKQLQHELGDRVRLRHPRPGRGADAVRPDRRLQQRPDRAARNAAGAVRAPELPVRRGLRRHVEPVRPRARAQHPRPRRRVLHPAEKLELHTLPGGSGSPSAAGTLVESVYAGNSIRRVVDLDAGLRISVLESNDRTHRAELDRGSRVHVTWNDDDLRRLGGSTPAAAPDDDLPTADVPRSRGVAERQDS